MSGLFAECRELYGTDDLYLVLNVNKKASVKEVKRAYHRLSLAVHPDRVTHAKKEESTKKFQTLGKVYSILSNPESRKVYDETGEVDEENHLQEDKDWYQYWRLLFAKISVSDIKQFEEKYKGSSEELKDLKAAYISCEGDMDEILNTVMCADVDDVPRFRKIFKSMIKSGDLQVTPKFKADGKKQDMSRKAKAREEAEEADTMRQELGLGEGQNDLKQMILHNRQSREAQADSFFAQLEAKYAEPEAKKPKKSKKK